MKKIQPKPGQESVWDYPRPPRLEDSSKHVRVVFNGEIIADSHRTKRVLETSHPPVYYIPPEDIRMEYLKPTEHSSFCEFKGMAGYYSVEVKGKKNAQAGWYYPEPTKGFAALKGYIAFYPSKMDACYVADEQVVAQEGDFYGGWITQDIVGPFKGGAGTWGW
ncbi:DUF427 domain-containing protein [Catalinimonas niigatensis]|uniref:DUF427 domain-containing protein n=1 Tax=Catalinimonas niigatensis TaxID=1397264 RepID=UPI0026651F46|nr:DUF427 domain-containing protein [Catalinimonas niigatensis]WPP53201.1 DUF427 domain-containing protein [Catalinimonas niigatensis]